MPIGWLYAYYMLPTTYCPGTRKLQNHRAFNQRSEHSQHRLLPHKNLVINRQLSESPTFFRKMLLMLQKSCVHQLSLLDHPIIFWGFGIHPKWLFGISCINSTTSWDSSDWKKHLGVDGSQCTSRSNWISESWSARWICWKNVLNHLPSTLQKKAQTPIKTSVIWVPGCYCISCWFIRRSWTFCFGAFPCLKNHIIMLL